LPLHVDIDQRVFLYFQRALDWVNEEGQLSAAMAVLVGGALHLLRRQLDAHFRENVTGLFKVDIAGLSHDPATYNL
jgi:hypothetical protein